MQILERPNMSLITIQIAHKTTISLYICGFVDNYKYARAFNELETTIYPVDVHTDQLSAKTLSFRWSMYYMPVIK